MSERQNPSDVSRTIIGLLTARAVSFPERQFVKCGSSWVTYGEMKRRSEVLARGFRRLGVRRGDRVALLSPNREELIETFFALAELGAVQVPLNPYLKGDFLKYQLEDSNPAYLITDGAGLASAQPLLAHLSISAIVALDPEPKDAHIDDAGTVSSYLSLMDEHDDSETGDTAADSQAADLVSIIYTSGTTGLPKGCMLSNGYYTCMPRGLIDNGWITESDRVASPFQFFHTSGQIVVMGCLAAGASALLTPEFRASTFLDEAHAEGATVLWGVGAMAMAIAARDPSPHDASRGFHRAFWIPLSPDQQQDWEARFSTPVIAEMYAQTECAPATVGNVEDRRRRTSSGKAVTYLDVRIVDAGDNALPPDSVGEIVIRPREPFSMYSGYWGNGDATAEAWQNLWHHTGDLGTLDTDGHLTFVDRKKDAVRRRGENVSSMQLEAAIAAFDKVQAVAVHAVPCALSEDDIKACIVLVPGSTFGPEELHRLFCQKLPYFAIPRYVEFYDYLPTNPLGRIRKDVLRKAASSRNTWDFHALGLGVARSDRR